MCIQTVMACIDVSVLTRGADPLRVIRLQNCVHVTAMIVLCLGGAMQALPSALPNWFSSRLPRPQTQSFYLLDVLFSESKSVHPRWRGLGRNSHEQKKEPLCAVKHLQCVHCCSEENAVKVMEFSRMDLSLQRKMYIPTWPTLPILASLSQLSLPCLSYSQTQKHTHWPNSTISVTTFVCF